MVVDDFKDNQSWVSDDTDLESILNLFKVL